MALTICQFCARLPGLGLDDSQHHPTVNSLVASAQLCPLCRSLLGWLPPYVVREARAALEARQYNILKMRDLDAAPESNDGISNEDLERRKRDRDMKRIWLLQFEVWLPTKSFTTTAFHVAGEQARARNRALWSSSIPVTFAARAPTIRDWLSECDSSHVACRVKRRADWDSELPARLLDIGTLDGRQEPRLVPTSEMQLAGFPPFLALSYCWGEDGVPVKTTKATLGGFMDQISTNSLPHTLRDAIAVVGAIGFRYIWIDCLCIVQDDEQDWMRESIKMASIFRHAVLTLCAASSPDCHGGLHISRALEPAIHFKSPGPGAVQVAVQEGVSTHARPFDRVRRITNRLRSRQSSPAHAPAQEKRLPEGAADSTVLIRAAVAKGTDAQSRLSSSPIHKRGWIFQEQLLSRRILYFLEGNMVWQCRALLESEDGLLLRQAGADQGRPPKLVTDEMLIDQDELSVSTRPGRAWWILLLQYFKRQFTYPKDSLPALAGITALWQEYTGDTPVVGLWIWDLPMHLAWRMNQKLRIPLDRNFPSWSWVSIPEIERHRLETVFDVGIYMPYYLPDRKPILWQAEIMKADVEWESRPLVSPLTRAVLRIKAPVLTRQKSSSGVSYFFDCNKNNGVWWDHVTHEDISSLEYLPLLATATSHPVEDKHLNPRLQNYLRFRVDCLVVTRVETGTTRRQYRRLGYVENGRSWNGSSEGTINRKFIKARELELQEALRVSETVELI